ncbi:hypothetical protein DFH29DRAFT_1005154 [Suillus ampliporus]|nr:hypothetical protein DFH29DRAFT_1005154 [Suillus ampliporus]
MSETTLLEELTIPLTDPVERIATMLTPATARAIEWLPKTILTFVDPILAADDASPIFWWSFLIQEKLDHAEAMHQEMDSQVTALDQQWAQKFATMEKRMQDIESQTDGNVASIGYIANALANPTTARFASFVPPPTKPSAQVTRMDKSLGP